MVPTVTETNKYSLDQIQQIINAIKHCQVLGIRAIQSSNGALSLELPYSNAIIGNPDTGVIHGGALSTLLDTVCGLSVAFSFKSIEICPTLDLRIDYMGAAQPNQSVFANAQIYRTTNDVIFCRGKAYQSDENTAVAHCVATFMRLPTADLQFSENWPL